MNRRHRLYEINTRVFLRRVSNGGKKIRLADVPDEYWKNLAKLGINLIWLMGIWKNCSDIAEQCCFEDGLMQSYDRALRDWAKEDVIGSPFSVNSYEVNPDIATADELKAVKKKLNYLGIGLILDYIPNHFGASTSYLKTNPEVFLECQRGKSELDNHTFFTLASVPDMYFAHGRDPFFPAWTDTVQVNYAKPEAREFMINRLEGISAMADGVRCDMAMLVLNNVFKNTWGGCLGESLPNLPEFWQEAIHKVKALKPEFIFIAEAYWDLEYQLQQLGFDYTYDKKLYDRLRHNPVSSIYGHLHADAGFQEKSVRFIENHDEERAIQAFGKEKSLVAAAVISTIPGMAFYHDGQFEGKKIKLPVQLGREPAEHFNAPVHQAYMTLMHIVSDPAFTRGVWERLDVNPSSPDNSLFENMLAWQWKLAGHSVLCVFNYSHERSQCRIVLGLEGYEEQFKLIDLLTGTDYIRASEEVRHRGLYIDLMPWHYHIFRY